MKLKAISMVAFEQILAQRRNLSWRETHLVLSRTLHAHSCVHLLCLQNEIGSTTQIIVILLGSSQRHYSPNEPREALCSQLSGLDDWH